MSEPVSVTVAVHERRIGELEQETQRHRERLHILENERAALQLLAKRVDDLAETAKVTSKTVAHASDDLKQLLVQQATAGAVSAYRRTMMIAAAAVLSAGWWLPDLIRAVHP